MFGGRSNPPKPVFCHPYNRPGDIMSASVDVNQLVQVVGDAIVVADPNNIITL